jgi:hypothetical protein
VKVLEEAGAGLVLAFKGEEELNKIADRWMVAWKNFQVFARPFEASNVNQQVFTEYSAKAVTEKLAHLLQKALQPN